jgi:S-adenosylmethionine hydrolase
VPLDAFGAAVRDPVRLPSPEPHRVDGDLEGQVMFVDRFGNALTNLTGDALEAHFPRVPEARLEVWLPMRRVGAIVRSYGDAPIGTLVAVMGSSRRIEIAQVGGHAAERLGLGEGDRVRVRLAG